MNGEMRRRTMLRGAAGVVIAWLTPVASAAQDARTARPAIDDFLVKTNDPTLEPLTPADISTSTPMIAWAVQPADRTVRNGSRLNRILLMRFEPDALDPKTQALAADGVVAYSAICTHTGCDIGSWLEDEQALYCECHESKFDAKNNAQVIDGPAPRSLPALPLKLVDGRLIVAGPFTSRVGFESG